MELRAAPAQKEHLQKQHLKIPQWGVDLHRPALTHPDEGLILGICLSGGVLRPKVQQLQLLDADALQRLLRACPPRHTRRRIRLASDGNPTAGACSMERTGCSDCTWARYHVDVHMHYNAQAVTLWTTT